MERRTRSGENGTANALPLFGDDLAHISMIREWPLFWTPADSSLTTSCNLIFPPKRPRLSSERALRMSLPVRTLKLPGWWCVYRPLSFSVKSRQIIVSDVQHNADRENYVRSVSFRGVRRSGVDWRDPPCPPVTRMRTS